MLQDPPEELATLLTKRHPVPAPGFWVPLAGGQTNRSWRVRMQRETWVIKLYAEANDNPLFPNSARDEASVLRFLAPAGLAPRLIDDMATAQGPCLIYAYQDGATWREDPVPVARALSLLHRQDLGALPPGLRRLAGGSVSLGAQTDAILARLPDGDRRRLLALRPRGSVAASGEMVLLHGDLVPGNVIVGKSRVSLIDWQCPAIGDPAEDLALFLSPAMQWLSRGSPLSEAESSEFIDAYGSDAVRRRIETLAPWHHWRMAAYCAWKAAQGCPGYKDAGALEIAALMA